MDIKRMHCMIEKLSDVPKAKWNLESKMLILAKWEK